MARQSQNLTHWSVFAGRGVTHLPADGVTSLRAIADTFNDKETPRGGAWGPSSVRNLFARVAA